MNSGHTSAKKTRIDETEGSAEKVSPRGIIVLRQTTVTGWKSFKQLEQWAEGKRYEYKDGALYIYDQEIDNYDNFKDKHGRKLKCDGTCTLIYRFVGQHTLKGDPIDNQ